MYVEDDENLDALLLLFIKYIYFLWWLPERKAKITTLRYINEAKNMFIIIGIIHV